jgi:hypothetical protein
MADTRNGSTTTADAALFLELGTTGLRQYGGYVREALLPELVGLQGVRTYKQMSHDDMVGAVLFANETLIRQVGWRVEPADASRTAVDAAGLVDGMLMQDMSQSWPMFVSEALSFQLYGWAYHEICWKRRLGDTPPPGYSPDDPAWDWWAPSQFADGLLGLRKLPIRSQDTLLRWEFDRHGGVQAMQQQDPVAGKLATIPIDKALLFRLFSHKGNPEGQSLFHAAYESYYAKKHIRRIEGIGIERDLAGMFHAGIPPECLSLNASPDQVALREYVKKMATQVHRDELEGLVTPLAYDERGNKLFEFSLLSTGGTRQFNTVEILQRYDTRILQSVLANVLMVGMMGGRGGSYSLGETLSDLYTQGLSTMLDAITEVLNRHLLPRLWRLNALPRATQPTLVHGEVKRVDFDKFTAGVLRLSQAGMVLTPQDEAHVRMETGFPEAQPQEVGL